jgi:hypothetical protein
MLMDVDAPLASDFEEVDSDEAPPPPKKRGAATAKAKAPAKKAPAKKAPAKGKGKKVQVRVHRGFGLSRPFRLIFGSVRTERVG